jgi:ABC-2 type transport system ATP-binding protein
MRGLLRSLADEGRAVLVSSHLMSELQDIAGHVVVVGAGRVVQAARTTDLTARFGSLEAAYLELTRGLGVLS